MRTRLIIFLFIGLTYQSFCQSYETIRFIKTDEVEEGDGAKVNRLIPQRGLKHYDPFVLFDDFTIYPPSGFSDHFHSGFEVVSYLTSGKLEHKDSKGNQVVLEAGDVQCFTTGSGIVHSEMPKGKDEVRGFQIWINLPKEDKLIEPSYEVVRASNFETTKINSQVSISTIVGQGASVRTRAEVLIQKFNMKAGAKYKLVLPIGYQGLVYVMTGSIMIEGKQCGLRDAVLFSREDLETVAVDDVSILVVSGLPLGQPIHRKGSIVK